MVLDIKKNKTVLPIVGKTVEKVYGHIQIKYPVYDRLTHMGCNYRRIIYDQMVYVIGYAYTNAIEEFWSLCNMVFVACCTPLTRNILKAI